MTTTLKIENPVDEVLSEVHATKERLAAKHGFNLNRITAEIRDQQRKSNARVVSRRVAHSATLQSP